MVRLEMLQVARLAPTMLGSAAERVAEYLRGQIGDDGGARDRAGRADLYYTVFALEGLIALHQTPPIAKVRPFLDRFGDGDGLDLVHLCCLARCRAALGSGAGNGASARRLADRIGAFRARDGGFAPTPGAAAGTVYHAFLATGALQDLRAPIGDPGAIAASIAAARCPDGSYAGGPGIGAGSTPTTAAAVTLLRQLDAPVPAAAGEWLLARAHPKGGFAATADAPVPDLLSTATALHALAGMQVPFGGIKEATLDFLDSLWTGSAFCGTWADDAQDSEYTYYALLALGHLSLV
jgi:hypothetical protein